MKNKNKVLRVIMSNYSYFITSTINLHIDNLTNLIKRDFLVNLVIKAKNIGKNE